MGGWAYYPLQKAMPNMGEPTVRQIESTRRTLRGWAAPPRSQRKGCYVPYSLDPLVRYSNGQLAWRASRGSVVVSFPRRRQKVCAGSPLVTMRSAEAAFAGELLDLALARLPAGSVEKDGDR